MAAKKKPRLAVWKFASCDGCQLSILDCEDELLEIATNLEIAYFPEASSNFATGPYDISLVEGSISQKDHIEQIRKIRKISKLLITIGACSFSGGIQALRNFKKLEEFKSVVYPCRKDIETMKKSLPVASFVEVDYQLGGCPISKEQLKEVISSFMAARTPQIPTYSLCLECKRKGVVCVAVRENKLCLGPLTRAGCGAICPSYQRGCYGCFGPSLYPNPSALSNFWIEKGYTKEKLSLIFRTFNAYAKEFYEESKRIEQK